MPDQIPSFKFDDAAFQKNVIDQETYLSDFVGKKNHNPFFQLNKLGELRKKYAAGDRSKELFDAAASFTKTPPSFEAPKAEAKKEEPTKPTAEGK